MTVLGSFDEKGIHAYRCRKEFENTTIDNPIIMLTWPEIK